MNPCKLICVPSITRKMKKNRVTASNVCHSREIPESFQRTSLVQSGRKFHHQPIWQKENKQPYHKRSCLSFTRRCFFSSSSYDSTHICTTLHLAYWRQMQLPDFFLIGPSGHAALCWSSIESKHSATSCWDCSFFFFFFIYGLPILEHTFQTDGTDQWNTGFEALNVSTCLS